MMDSITGALKSKTMGFAGGVILLGIVDQLQGVIPMIVPDDYRGVAIAAVGLVIAYLRVLTKQPLAEK
jgi:hypothetical protein